VRHPATAILFVLLSPAFQATAASFCVPLPEGCASDGIATTSHVPHTDVSGNIDVNAELDDWAALYMDSISRGPCLARAAARWSARLAAAGMSESGAMRRVSNRAQGSVDYYRQVYAGAIVTHIFAAARNFDRWRADLPASIGPLLADVRRRFADIASPQDPGCGLESLEHHAGVNSCMDDHALTASGDAWIAAFEYQQGRSHSLWASRARGELSNALSPMSNRTDPTRGGGPCIQSTTAADPRNCAGSMEDFNRDSSRFRIIGADHGIENPSYGIGMMPSVASACAGLFDAGEPCTFTPDEKTVARELMGSAQRVASRNGDEWDHSGCLDFVDGKSVACGDETIALPSETYRPLDFPMLYFYRRHGITERAPVGEGFSFDRYCEPRTIYPPAYNKLWGPNRLTFYYTFAYGLFQPDAEAPQVEIQWPPDGTVSGRVRFEARASDDHRARVVAYYANGSRSPFCSTLWPFECVVDTSSGKLDGSYSVVAAAFDDAGNRGVSAPIDITVRNSSRRNDVAGILFVLLSALVALRSMLRWRRRRSRIAR
jgi:hypothetical protein